MTGLESALGCTLSPAPLTTMATTLASPDEAATLHVFNSSDMRSTMLTFSELRALGLHGERGVCITVHAHSFEGSSQLPIPPVQGEGGQSI